MTDNEFHFIMEIRKHVGRQPTERERNVWLARYRSDRDDAYKRLCAMVAEKKDQARTEPGLQPMENHYAAQAT